MTPKLSSRHRRALRLTTRFLAPYRWQVIAALLALIVTAAVTLSMGQGIKLLVDRGFMTQSPHQLNQSIGIFMLMVLGLAVGTFARFYWVSWIGERCVADIRREVFNHLVYLHPGFYENNRSSEIQSRLTADTTLLQSVIGSSLSMFLRNLLMVIGGVVGAFLSSGSWTRFASGSSIFTLCDISGAVMMKMISSTNITSTRGVTLISAIGPPLLPLLKAMTGSV